MDKTKRLGILIIGIIVGGIIELIDACGLFMFNYDIGLLILFVVQGCLSIADGYLLYEKEQNKYSILIILCGIFIIAFAIYIVFFKNI
ncbi:hypothetical protein [Clostridium sp. ZS2-4]|uniref:hypothetical protein n=1 Tax=Clostridium sp. ZS2-4 TaxID=2987703 RepID=UPI00227CFFFF|nr:hypothetical protein [Clostridium sp. ZS2-4]MCY6356247.1 hypothetical protein [Clostridium sp. ZS2-4]